MIRRNEILLRLTMVGLLASALPASGADKSITLQRTYDATVDQVYAAEVRAVGSTLKNAVKEACLVNFQTRLVSGQFYRILDWTAACNDLGNGKVGVTLTFQMNSNMFVNGKAQRSDADKFWANMDAALKNPVSTASADSAGPAPSSLDQNGSPDANAGVAVSSEPAGADISVDGEYVGNTPSQLKLKPGSHAIKIELKGYDAWERTMKIEAGESRRIVAELTKSTQ